MKKIVTMERNARSDARMPETCGVAWRAAARGAAAVTNDSEL